MVPMVGVIFEDGLKTPERPISQVELYTLRLCAEWKSAIAPACNLKKTTQNKSQVALFSVDVIFCV